MALIYLSFFEKYTIPKNALSFSVKRKDKSININSVKHKKSVPYKDYIKNLNEIPKNRNLLFWLCASGLWCSHIWQRSAAKCAQALQRGPQS